MVVVVVVVVVAVVVVVMVMVVELGNNMPFCADRLPHTYPAEGKALIKQRRFPESHERRNNMSRVAGFGYY